MLSSIARCGKLFGNALRVLNVSAPKTVAKPSLTSRRAFLCTSSALSEPISHELADADISIKKLVQSNQLFFHSWDDNYCDGVQACFGVEIHLHMFFGNQVVNRAKSIVQTMELIEPNAVVLQLPRASESLLEANSDEEMSEFSAAYKAAKQLEDCEVFFEDTPLIGLRNIKNARENYVLSKKDQRFCELIRAAERVTVDKECKEIWSAVSVFYPQGGPQHIDFPADVTVLIVFDQPDGTSLKQDTLDAVLAILMRRQNFNYWDEDEEEDDEDEDDDDESEDDDEEGCGRSDDG